MIKQINGEVLVSEEIAPASTVFALNDVVTRDSAGKLARATSTTPRSRLLGLIQKTVAATDDDYASDKVVAVHLFHKGAEFEMDVDTGTLLTTMRHKRFDLADHNGINVNASTQKAVEIERYISASKARGRFITDGDAMRLQAYAETVGVASFTDGGSTAGTYSLKTSIPAGAIFARSLVKGITGFAGDTTAVLTIGDGTDVDRYNTGTPSVFATAAAGVDVGAPSGTVWHTAAKTPILTVTTATDFGLTVTDGNGELTVVLFWYEME